MITTNPIGDLNANHDESYDGDKDAKKCSEDARNVLDADVALILKLHDA